MRYRPPPNILKITLPGHTQLYIYSEKDNHFIPLDEPCLAKQIPGYARLNEKARQKELVKFLKDAKIIRTVKLDGPLPNTSHNPWTKKAFQEELRETLTALLSVTRLFEAPIAGHLLLADTLCAMHCKALREAAPSFHPAISIKSMSPEIEKLLKNLVRAAVTKKRWHKKHAELRRTAILDYRVPPGGFPHHIQDFSQWKISVKGYKALKIPAAYEDTVLLIAGATDAQMKEAAPYLGNAAVILLNSAPGDLAPTGLTASNIGSYDPEVVKQLEEHCNRIASLLQWWWSLFDDEEAWAREIVQEARASFGKPDDRYIRVELDPKKLRDAIRYRVLLSFLDELEACEFMTAEELASYRQAAKNVFDPAPPEPVVSRKAEDPEVFLEIMRELTAQNTSSIVAEDARFVKSDKPFGAWRTISKEPYLVLLEDAWTKAYPKAAKAKVGVDCSFFQQNNWELELQKVLVEQELIKAPSSGYRYRYDLFGNGTRDKTYVVAIPTKYLDI